MEDMAGHGTEADGVSGGKTVPVTGQLVAPTQDPSKGERELLGDLARAFRMKIVEILAKPDVILKIEQRLIAELQDEMEVKIAPTVLKLGAASHAEERSADTGKLPPINIHIHKLTDQQLRDWAERGVRPVLPGITGG